MAFQNTGPKGCIRGYRRFVNMSCLGLPTVLFFVAFLWENVSADIYKSVMWTTNNPLFHNSSGLSPCFGEDLEIRVHLKSTLPIVCPFEFIIMQTLPSRPAAGILYENLWIVYDDKSFLTCNINTTYQNKQGEKNKKLFDCNTPHILKSYITVDFIKEKSPVNPGISFVGGEYYYFLATSDGTDGSLNNTKGGHCNDAKVRMKFKIYICMDNDEKCRNVPIGDLHCPGDYKKAVSTTPFTTTKPSTQASITQPKPTSGDNVTTDSIDVTKSPISGNNVMTDPIVSNHNETKGTSGTMQFLESQKLRDELLFWKNVAIASICLAVVAVILIVIVVYWYMKRHKTKTACLTDQNDVTPHLPEYNGDDDKRTDGKNSFNNPSFTHDSIDGKKGNHVSSCKPNQAKKPMEMSPVPGGDKQDTKSKPLEQNDASQKEDPDKSKSEVNSEKTTNGLVVRDSGGREKRQHNQNDGRERLPPLRTPERPHFIEV